MDWLASGATLKVILLKLPEPSTPTVYDAPEPGSCLTLSTKTWISFSPPAGISVDISNVVVEPSPVKVLLLATPDKTVLVLFLNMPFMFSLYNNLLYVFKYRDCSV